MRDGKGDKVEGRIKGDSRRGGQREAGHKWRGKTESRKEMKIKTAG